MRTTAYVCDACGDHVVSPCGDSWVTLHGKTGFGQEVWFTQAKDSIDLCPDCFAKVQALVGGEDVDGAVDGADACFVCEGSGHDARCPDGDDVDPEHRVRCSGCCARCSRGAP